MANKRQQSDLTSLREACAIAATVLERLCQAVEPGITTYDLDQMGREWMGEFGAQSACYNYRSGSRSYPSYTCLSVNDEVVHGIGTLKRILVEGDIISVDVCVDYEGWIGDNARTVAVAAISEELETLLTTTEQALYHGIEQARAGNRVGDISHAIQRTVEKQGFGIVREFVGHAVGRSMHEEPQIPNFGRRGKGVRLREGMALAIEPMVTMGKHAVRILEDGWTAVTLDGKPAAHFEHTVLITADAAEILTIPKN